MAQTTRVFPSWLREVAFRYTLASLRSSYRLNLLLRYGWSRKPDRPVFIVCTLRTGSNLLSSYLNSVPGVSIAGEILHPDQVTGVPRTGISKQAVIRHIQMSLNHCGSEFCGAKLPARHLQFHGLDVRQVHDYFPSSKVIILYRRSVADQYLSFQIARATQRWRATRRQEPIRISQKIEVDRDDFLKYCRELKAFYSGTLALEGIRSYALVLSYEDLVGNAQGVFDEKLFPFLGLPAVLISTDQIKTMKGPPSEVVGNFESVRDLWEHSDFIQNYQ